MESVDALKGDSSSPLVETNNSFNNLGSCVNFSLHAVCGVSKLRLRVILLLELLVMALMLLENIENSSGVLSFL